MAVLLKCPNCGAPLQGVALGALRACPYCGSLIALPEATGPAPAPTHGPRTRVPAAVWLAPLGVVGIAAIALGASVVVQSRASRGPNAATTPTAPAPKTAQPAASGVAWSRLENVDLHMKLAQAQVQMPALFPEATADQHRKVYSLNFQHPVLRRGFLSWEWGCDCLEGIVFFFKDYPTRQHAGDSFIPCLARELGKTSTSAPPFDYEWAARAGAPRVHLGPQMLSLDFERDSSQEGLRTVLRALASCRQ